MWSGGARRGRSWVEDVEAEASGEGELFWSDGPGQTSALRATRAASASGGEAGSGCIGWSRVGGAVVKRTPLDRWAAAGRTDQQIDAGEREEKVAPRRRLFWNGCLGYGGVVDGLETTSGGLKLGVDVSGGDKTVVAYFDESAG